MDEQGIDLYSCVVKITTIIMAEEGDKSGSKYAIAFNLFIVSSVIVVINAILYLAGTAAFSVSIGMLDDSTIVDLVFEVFLLFAGICFFSAAMLVKFKHEEGETYEKILAENAQNIASKKADCCSTCCTGNTYLIAGWLAFIGTLPLILFSVPYFPLIILGLLLCIILFMVAASPPYLAMNHGKGSICYCSNGEDTCGCECCKGEAGCKRPFSSDVVIVILALCIFSIFLMVAAIVNVCFLWYSVTAWLWLVAAVLFLTGMFLWFHAVVPPKVKPEEKEALLAKGPITTEPTSSV